MNDFIWRNVVPELQSFVNIANPTLSEQALSPDNGITGHYCSEPVEHFILG
jgi:hypothetical protein